ncbi:hypothetical protein COW36_12270 [bacterium (Candidatus Blackallbacteria) CG17_big_fil_post_rev_8_21_14_2_50_48_46]|uniref:Uncharacterized protein n=1 Tax=bacterium (Candidatus Blackallbacteria) CG17_big_fil_post_rev_8_21_14_2_50_48_46 TaxID=2014261 RepID=A0A2M7G3U5_9BACT|nr:MAG: hypothetical protein COW64_02990 [bacterium (Candidatus Blackallbacteria) CG18_big_fil_WC_8_21_14_2_50_49_26]PIW16535.1 MAG: hypothetical protein COW36_12270 [bacterium (Candidatus Blackallbacteria) CG17_big_fil_post_rev_8_21_14_2_50_48_46]PIW46043.1 MAG: hypothetical protein COW20_17535 [bacterium (Candidatus Blackallbacteria) CG13_big_fil_rev_8_21_14_2_50_49_14]
MAEGGLNIGSHDKGFWDPNNPVKANKTPLASGLSLEQALEKAKQHEGAELVIVDADGKANVHALTIEDGFWKENKQILISELDRDPNIKQDHGKTPLAIDNNIAQAFSGRGAFLVDEKNQSTFLGDDVDQTTANVKLQAADSYLKQPTQSRVDAAYVIAKDAGQEKHVDQFLAVQVLDRLKADYRQTAPAAQQISLLKTGAVKTKMEDLIGNLSGLAGQETQRVGELRGQLKTRTDTWVADLKTPTRERDSALDAWQTADRRETKRVNQTAHDLREARFPHVFELEATLADAKDHRSEMRSQLERASQSRSQAQANVNALERLPGEAEGHLQQARQLESENRGLYAQIQTYTALTLSQVSSDRRQAERDYQRASTDLDFERAKPNKPSAPPSSGDGSPYGTDPFKPGNGSPYGADPFADANKYRDLNRIDQLERQVSRAGREVRELKDRESSLESVNLRLAFTQDIDQISLLFYNLDPIDRVALSQYKDRKDSNVRSIANHQQSARNLQSRYQNEISGANRSLNSALSNEEAARGRYSQSESQVAGLEQDLSDLLAHPRSDTQAEVKPYFAAHQKALEHQEATVGAKAPLTVARDKTQARVDELNRVYRGDKSVLDGQIGNVQETLLNEAQAKIQATRTQVAH